MININDRIWCERDEERELLVILHEDEERSTEKKRTRRYVERNGMRAKQEHKDSSTKEPYGAFRDISSRLLSWERTLATKCQNMARQDSEANLHTWYDLPRRKALDASCHSRRVCPRGSSYLHEFQVILRSLFRRVAPRLG